MDKLFNNKHVPEDLQRHVASYFFEDESTRNSFKCASKHCNQLINAIALDHLFNGAPPETQLRIAKFVVKQGDGKSFKQVSKYCSSLVAEHTTHLTVHRDSCPGNFLGSIAKFYQRLTRLPKLNSVTFKINSYWDLLRPLVATHGLKLIHLQLLDSPDQDDSDHSGDYLDQTDFLTKLNNLKSLKVEPEPSESILDKVAQLTGLVSLDVGASPDEWDDLGSLAPLSNHTHLQHLKLSAFSGLTDITAIGVVA